MMTTTTAEAIRFRIGRGGQVHETWPGNVIAARCGEMVDHGEPTTEAVTCKMCSGRRANRGSRRRPTAVPVPALHRAADLALADRALTLLEEHNTRAWDRWASDHGILRKRHWNLPVAPPEAYPAPPAVVIELLVLLQRRYEGRMRSAPLATTLTAHEELLRLQNHLLPDCDRMASA